MNPTNSSEDDPAAAGSEEMTSALFASMVMQQTNMALILLGKRPHPETGQTALDIEGAKLFIDQLEMLEVKTRGNLDPREDRLLKQSLTALRMAFVEAVDAPAGSPAPTPPPAPHEPPAAGAAPSGPGTAPPPEDASRKKFSKKY